MAEKKKKKQRGLAAIAQAREDRSRGGQRWTTSAGLAGAAAIVGGLIAYKVVSDRELNAGKQDLLAKQRSVAVTLGTEWYPLRDVLEGEVLSASKEFAGDLVEADARKEEFRSQPGLYLRMRVADAKDAASVRKVAADAKKDSFATCFLREPNERGLRGDLDGGAFAEQPWNLGQAYAATRVLTDEWVQNVKDADDELRLRVFEQQYDKAVKEEIPLAVDVVRHARFFLLVLDEDVPEAAQHAEGGAIDESALQLVGHPARVHLFDLQGKREVVRMRRSADARIVPASGIPLGGEMREAMQRQANNCMLAQTVLDAIASK